MAVGKGSMARAAKAAEKKAKPEEGKEIGTKRTAEEKAAVKTAPEKKTAVARKTAKAVAAAEVIAAPSGEVLQQIVYQKSSGMLEREAAPNEIFGLGDEMPVYYF